LEQFRFASIDYLEVATFDNSLDHFHRDGIRGTIKENIQNALDARLFEDQPVKVTIRMYEVPKKILPGIDEVFNHINSLVGHNTYTTETINYMKSKEIIDKVPVISFEDSNSKGLSGAKNGQSNNRQDTYGIYAYNKGVHFVEDDMDKELKRGGSHGIGKIANNAASDIHLMYFANCDHENNKHLGATIQLIEHTLNNETYRATGYYTDMEKESGKLIPFENKSLHKALRKDTRGLKIIIPYVRAEFFDYVEIIRAVCDDFFLAILENNLVVEVFEVDEELTLIDKNTIVTLIKDSRFYYTDIEDMRKVFTPLYVDTLSNEKPIPIEVSNNKDIFNFKLYFTYNPEIVVGRVAILRTIGMKIEDLGVNGHKRKPFNAVLVGGAKEDRYLKSLENESHTKLSFDDIRDETEKKNAKKFITNLHKKLAEVIDEHFNKNNPANGNLETDDLIFETESSFKNLLDSTSEKIVINSGNIVHKRNGKEKRDKKGNKSTSENSNKKKERRPRKIKTDSESTVEQFVTPNDAVSRLFIQTDEIIYIDLYKVGLDLTKYKLNKTCNLIFKIVDGNGEIVGDDFDFSLYISNISDINTQKHYTYSDNKIKNIEVTNNKIQIKINLINDNMTKLKFMYELEVEK